MSIYEEERPSPECRQITFTFSIWFIIEAMTPSDVIFDEIGEITALRVPGDAVQKKCILVLFIFLDLPFGPDRVHRLPDRAHVLPLWEIDCACFCGCWMKISRCSYAVLIFITYTRNTRDILSRPRGGAHIMIGTS